MKKVYDILSTIFAVTLFAFLFSACAAIEKHEAMDTERTLSAAGFKMKFADTPKQLLNTQTMVQRQLVSHMKDGSVYYVYADAEFCKCLYVGSDEAYQRYQKLAIKQEIANERIQAAEINENAAMNWGAWGGWGPR